MPYRWFYCILILVGAVLKLNFVWSFADIANAFMAVPNIIGIIGLSGLVVSLTKKYSDRT